MSQSRLIALTYFDPGKSVRLTVYADTIILDRNGEDSVISAVRFGGYQIGRASCRERVCLSV